MSLVHVVTYGEAPHAGRVQGVFSDMREAERHAQRVMAGKGGEWSELWLHRQPRGTVSAWRQDARHVKIERHEVDVHVRLREEGVL